MFYRRRHTRIILVCAVLAAFSILGSPASAQELARVTLPVIVNVPQIVVLEVNTDELVFEQQDFQDPELAITTEEGILVTKSKAISVNVFGNIGYQVLISTNSESQIFGGSDGDVIPTQQLEWRLSPPDDVVADEKDAEESHNWNKLSNTRHPITSRSSPGELTFDLDFRLFVTWQNSPAEYQGIILLTVMPTE